MPTSAPVALLSPMYRGQSFLRSSRRYAHVETVLVTAPQDVLTSRLSRRLRRSDGSVIDRVKRNDLFVDFRADHVIETTGIPDVAVRLLLEVIHRRGHRAH